MATVSSASSSPSTAYPNITLCQSRLSESQIKALIACATKRRDAYARSSLKPSNLAARTQLLENLISGSYRKITAVQCSMNLGMMSADEGKYTEARIHFIHAHEITSLLIESLKEHPHHDLLICNPTELTCVQMCKDALDQLIETEFKFRMSDPDASIDLVWHTKKQLALYKEQRNEGTIKVDPQKRKTLEFQLYLAHYLEGNYEEALAGFIAFSHSHCLDNDVYTLYILASCYEKLEKIPQAIKYYTQILSHPILREFEPGLLDQDSVPRDFYLLFGTPAKGSSDNQQRIINAVKNALERCKNPSPDSQDSFLNVLSSYLPFANSSPPD